MTTFSQISIRGWRQFEQIDIDLSKQVTVLTGPNGSGKTTVLNILCKHFGWNLNFVSTPFWGRTKTKQFWSDVQKARSQELTPEDARNAANTVGHIRYSDGNECGLQTNTFVSAQYQLTYDQQQAVVGLHIPSHRPPAVYNNVTTIPTNPKTVQEHYQDFQQILFQTFGESPRRNPGVAQKQSVIALALFGYGNEAVAPNLEYRNIFESFQIVLSKVLPKEIGFRKLEVRMPEVVLVTDSGDFSLDAMSGGINALFGMAWQIHMYGAGKDACTVTIDEPENHLHPSMQRAFLPAFADAFPYCRFIVATHSPFIVSSHDKSSVYGLRFGANRSVVSTQLSEGDLSGTPNRILKEILDVPSNLPIWVEDRVRSVLQHSDPNDPERFARELMEELRSIGITDGLSDLDI